MAEEKKKRAINRLESSALARPLVNKMYMEGVLAGMSSGAAVAGALRVAKSMKKGTVVTILPDRGDRYLSTMLFRSVCARCPP